MQDNPLVLLRELKDPGEVAAMLRLRHRIYFEQHEYGSPKPLSIDLTAHDQRARLLGLFRDGVLVGGLRLVFRFDQPLAHAIRAMRAVVGDVVSEHSGSALPSEEAFDLAPVLGLRRGLVDVEVGRLVVDRATVSPGVVLKLMVATLAVLHLLRVRYYLYSCAQTIAARYARVTKPRWVFETAAQAGIGSDCFVFPKQSCAGVASVEDSPYFEAALSYAYELQRTGSIVLSSALPTAHTELDFGRYLAS